MWFFEDFFKLLGNACEFMQYKHDGEVIKSSNIKVAGGSIVPVKVAQYRVPNYVSKLSPAYFAGLPSEEKDTLLAEAFKILVATVEPGKILEHKNELLVKSLNMTKGKITNLQGDEYQGDIIEGVASGKGKIKSKDGSVYEGGVFNGLEHGHGKVVEAGAETRTYSAEFYQGVPIGPVEQKIDAKTDDTGVLEGAFDTNGQESGPYLMRYQDGDQAYFSQKNGLCEGMHILVAKDKNSVVVTDFKGGKEVKEGTVFNPPSMPSK